VTIREALAEAFLLGFSLSRDGYNGEVAVYGLCNGLASEDRLLTIRENVATTEEFQEGLREALERIPIAICTPDIVRAAAHDLVSAVRTINFSPRNQVMIPGDDEPCHWQRREWIEWLLGEAAKLESAFAGESAPAGWIPGEPPRDGCFYGAQGEVVWSDEFGGGSYPFFTIAIFKDGLWLDQNGQRIAFLERDELRFDFHISAPPGHL
jgi:hypothetical protein